MKIGNSGRILNIKSVLIGLASGIVVSLALGAITAGMIAGGTVEEGMIGALCAIIHATASFVSGMMAGKLSHEKRGVYASVASGLYLLSWIGAAVLFWNGVQIHFEHVLIATISGAALAWMLLMIPKGTNRHKYTKRFS